MTRSIVVAMCALGLYADMKHLPAEEAVSPTWGSAAVLALLVLLVRRVMIERDLPVEAAPAIDET